MYIDCSVESWCYQDSGETGDMCETFLPGNLLINSQVLQLTAQLVSTCNHAVSTLRESDWVSLSQVNWRRKNISRLLVPQSCLGWGCLGPTDGYSINSVALIKCGISDVLDLFKINRNPKQHIRKWKINGRYTVDKTNNSSATDQFLILRRYKKFSGKKVPSLCF